MNFAASSQCERAMLNSHVHVDRELKNRMKLCICGKLRIIRRVEQMYSRGIYRSVFWISESDVSFYQP